MATGLVVLATGLDSRVVLAVLAGWCCPGGSTPGWTRVPAELRRLAADAAADLRMTERDGKLRNAAG